MTSDVPSDIIASHRVVGVPLWGPPCAAGPAGGAGVSGASLLLQQGWGVEGHAVRGPPGRPCVVRIAAPSPGGPSAPGGVTAGEAEQDASQQGHDGGRQARVEALAQLVLVHRRQTGLVEGLHHLVGDPGDGNEAQEAGQEEAAAGRPSHLGLAGGAVQADGTLHAQVGGDAAEDGQHVGGDHHGAGCLQVGGQRQDGVVGVALEGAGALEDALHPQALLLLHCRHDAVDGEGRGLPVGQQRDHQSGQHAQNAQDEAQELQPHHWHGRPACSSCGLLGRNSDSNPPMLLLGHVVGLWHLLSSSFMEDSLLPSSVPQTSSVPWVGSHLL